jgi:uncharacterized protein YciI
MSTFAVIREAGPAWHDGGILDQPEVDQHAAFMEARARDGFVLLGGPLAGTERGRVRVLLVVEARDESDVRRRLAADPWTVGDLLRISSVEPWTILVGEPGRQGTGRDTSSVIRGASPNRVEA